MISFWICIYIQYFIDVVRNKLQTINIYTRVDRKKIKNPRKECHKNAFSILTNEKHFPKIISQWELNYGLFTNLPRIIVACDFSTSSFKLERGILLYWKNGYPNLKTTCHIRLKFFLWTKLLESLLLAKYIISAAVTLR